MNGQGYDLVLMGQLEPTHIDIDVLNERLQQPAYRRSARLSGVGIGSLLGSALDLRRPCRRVGTMARDADINRDRNLRLQYLAGLGITGMSRT